MLLAALKNVGTSSAETLVTERENNGKFKDLYDFFSRVDAGRLTNRCWKVLSKLVLLTVYGIIANKYCVI